MPECMTIPDLTNRAQEVMSASEAGRNLEIDLALVRNCTVHSEGAGGGVKAFLVNLGPLQTLGRRRRGVRNRGDVDKNWSLHVE